MSKPFIHSGVNAAPTVWPPPTLELSLTEGLPKSTLRSISEENICSDQSGEQLGVWGGIGQSLPGLWSTARFIDVVLQYSYL